jgi:transketolase
MDEPMTFSDPAAVPLDERSRYLRSLVVDALEGGGRGHVGSTLSLIEIIRVLYDDVLDVRPTDPNWAERDRFILSKGHGCLALYAVLADKGFFELDKLRLQCRAEAMLGGHPERGHAPGVEASTGALGHGLSIGIGMAMAARLQKRKSRVFVVMGDGELDEGSVWEGALCAAKHRLSSLTAIVDYNKLQSYGLKREVQDLEPLTDKWRAFGFEVRECNGHHLGELAQAFRPASDERPVAVICHTIKGKGMPFAEQNPGWHHKAKINESDVQKMRGALGAST